MAQLGRVIAFGATVCLILSNCVFGQTTERDERISSSAAIAKIVEIAEENAALKARLEIQQAQHAAETAMLKKKLDFYTMLSKEKRAEQRSTSSASVNSENLQELTELAFRAHAMIRSSVAKTSERLAELRKESPEFIWMNREAKDPYAESFMKVWNKKTELQAEAVAIRSVLEQLKRARVAGREPESLILMVATSIKPEIEKDFQETLDRWNRTNEPSKQLKILEDDLVDRLRLLEEQDNVLNQLAEVNRSKSTSMQKHLAEYQLLTTELEAFQKLATAYAKKFDELGITAR